MSKYQTLAQFMNNWVARPNVGGNQKLFTQAVTEVMEGLFPFIKSNKKYNKDELLEKFVVPERIIQFRVPWRDAKGKVQINNGFRVQFNSAIGPYKGGLRFHPTVTLDTLKFLGFEQILKNSLTTLPIGGGKGGCDFDPKGKTDAEVESFCQSFMTELYRHIGPDTDVPAGDIGVGGREIGFMYGQYKRIRNEFTGVLTGKGLQWGGSKIRPEATGYGLVYFAENMMKTKGLEFTGLKVCLSGSGNVAQYAAEKCLQLGATPITFSDGNGTIYDQDGINEEKLAFVLQLKNVKRGRISEYVKKYPTAKYLDKQRPWSIPCDIALPCATQNEISLKDAEHLVKNGCKVVAEGANMPTEIPAISYFLKNKLLFSPGKASNAGGVATSGLEMSQNSIRYGWEREEVDAKLKNIMFKIHETCAQYGKEGEFVNYVKGANIGGFVKVADAMLDQGNV